MARGLVFRVLKEEGLHNLCSDNKGADHLCVSVPLISHMQKAGFLMTRLINEPLCSKYQVGSFLLVKIWFVSR